MLNELIKEIQTKLDKQLELVEKSKVCLNIDNMPYQYKDQVFDYLQKNGWYVELGFNKICAERMTIDEKFHNSKGVGT